MSINWRTALTKTKDFILLTVKKYFVFLLHLTPHQNVAQTVLSYTLLGWLLLSLPFMTVDKVGFLDNLFTSAAAVSTAGLQTVNFADSYTFLGKLVVLVLVQIGGVGYMTFSSFVFLALAKKHRLRKSQEEALTADVKLPEDLKLSDFLWSALVFTAIAESIGTVFLFNYFRHNDFTVLNAAWYSVFHSVSAFCTAGYTLWNNNFIDFTDSKTINTVISCLSLAGAVGFIVAADLFNFIRRKTQEISFTTKIITLTTLVILAFGTFTLFVTTPHLSLAEAFFQTMGASTTSGFNTADISKLSSCSVLILILIMSIGGSPSGTAGVKTTTFASVLAIVHSHLRLNPRVEFLGHTVPVQRLYAATSTVLLYSVFLFTSVFLLTWTENIPFLNLLFEATAALSTAGFSMETTTQLSTVGKLIIIATMLIGRIGVVTFSLAVMSSDADEVKPKPAAERADVAV